MKQIICDRCKRPIPTSTPMFVDPPVAGYVIKNMEFSHFVVHTDSHKSWEDADLCKQCIRDIVDADITRNEGSAA